MIVTPSVTIMVGVFTMGFGIMASVVTNNVSALGALANALLRLGKVKRVERTGCAVAGTPVEPAREDRASVEDAATLGTASPPVVSRIGDRIGILRGSDRSGMRRPYDLTAFASGSG